MRHYGTLETKLKAEVSVISEKMLADAQKATSLEVSQEHAHLLDKTEENIQKMCTKLKHVKENKLKRLGEGNVRQTSRGGHRGGSTTQGEGVRPTTIDIRPTISASSS